MTTIKIGEFLHRKKVPVEIDPAYSYSLVTVKLHHKGLVLREKKLGSLLGSNMFRVSTGDFILSGIDARNGAFGIVPPELDGAIVTNDFWYFDVDETKVKRDFFYWLTSTPLFLDACQKSSKGETQRIRLQKDLFNDFEFHFPPVDQQEDFLCRFNQIDASLSQLDTESDQQSSLLTQLRQAILQEAIEGKLTAGWRQKHPVVKGDPETDAAELLSQIQAEKVRLVAEGTIKKPKPLVPIREEEAPFAMPEGWVWGRISTVAQQIVDCPHSTPHYLPQGKLCLRSQNIIPGGLLLENASYVSAAEFDFRVSRLRPRRYDLVYIREGGRLGVAGIIRTDRDVCLGQRLMLLRFISDSTAEFVAHFLNARQTFERIVSKTLGSAAPRINVKDIADQLLPLPPLAEQRVIVERVERLLAMVDELEQQVIERKRQAEALLQTVLAEAFGESAKTAGK